MDPDDDEEGPPEAQGEPPDGATKGPGSTEGAYAGLPRALGALAVRVALAAGVLEVAWRLAPPAGAAGTAPGRLARALDALAGTPTAAALGGGLLLWALAPGAPARSGGPEASGLEFSGPRG